MWFSYIKYTEDGLCVRLREPGKTRYSSADARGELIYTFGKKYNRIETI